MEPVFYSPILLNSPQGRWNLQRWDGTLLQTRMQHYIGTELALQHIRLIVVLLPKMFRANPSPSWVEIICSFASRHPSSANSGITGKGEKRWRETLAKQGCTGSNATNDHNLTLVGKLTQLTHQCISKYTITPQSPDAV